jgi:uncharacterized membrane protein
MKLKLSLFVIIILLSSLATAATIKGNVYNSQLDLEENVLVEIDSQKLLSKDGDYTFELSPGTYTLTATKNDLVITETIKISKEGTFVYDMFLLGDLFDEDDLWQDTENDLFSENDLDVETESKSEWWRQALAGLIVLMLFIRFFWMRKKFGSISKFRRHHKSENRKTTAEHQEEIDNEPGYLERTLEIIKKHDGRIHQKTLRKEMLDISESKVSLILTELEHKGKIERIKKGRGKVIILKD